MPPDCPPRSGLAPRSRQRRSPGSSPKMAAGSAGGLARLGDGRQVTGRGQNPGPAATLLPPAPLRLRGRPRPAAAPPARPSGWVKWRRRGPGLGGPQGAERLLLLRPRRRGLGALPARPQGVLRLPWGAALPL